jgi:hypothetical protein
VWTSAFSRPAVRHPDHDLVRPAAGGELDRLVEHGHEHVEPLEENCFWPRNERRR